ncbi:MAG: hypothetical protein K9K63_15610 [Desulfotignum sp.]|nr:hypothetical protein [Desulfotignum sp.]MCF8088366.1 hypothetical protein [Desulfotignum sp.]MCF8138730.1 hypothetical protein [Desulfotignum sp.]
MGKKYRITTSCPRCGCTATSAMTEEEIKEKYGDVPNIELECNECMMKLEADVQEDDGSGNL